jgi:cysteine desulfurase
MPAIYLDYNATTPVAPEAREAMLPYLNEQYGNPSSDHALGQASHRAVESARAQVAGLLGCAPESIVFTSGGSEANNLALKGIALARLAGSVPPSGHLVISAVEHPAIVKPAAFLQRLGFELTVVGVDRRGVVDPSEVEAALRPGTMLVSIMHANNETGALQPIRAIADICRGRGVPLHTDAAQSVGKIPANVDHLGVDLLTVAGHKLYAPKGVGALYVRPGLELEPLIHGAGHERGLRAGTENVAYLAGLGAAAQLAADSLAATARRMAALRDRLHERLLAGIGPALSLNGAGAERLPNTLSVNFPGLAGGELLARLPQLCASTGAACHSGEARLSATLTAMGVDPELGRGCVRLSVGRYTTEDEVDRAAQYLVDAWSAV